MVDCIIPIIDFLPSSGSVAKIGKVELYRVEGGTLNRSSLPRKQQGEEARHARQGSIIIHQNNKIIKSRSIPTVYKRHIKGIV